MYFTQVILKTPVSDATATTERTSISITHYKLDAAKVCSGESVCSSLKLIGDTIACNSLPLQFVARKNKECKSLINWSVSPLAVINTVNDTTVSIKFIQSGNYMLYAYINTACGTLKDSLEVHANISTVLDLGKDTFLCNEQTLTLHAGSQFKSYKWQDGSVDSDYVVENPGKYYVTVTDYCVSQYADTIIVKAAPSYQFSAGNDTSICNGDSLQLKVAKGFTNYQWSPTYNILNAQSENPIAYPENNISYFVQAQTPYGCYVYDTIFIAVKNSTRVFIGNDTSFCDGDSVVIGTNENFKSYQWNTSSTSSQIVIKAQGTYSLFATALNGCTSADTLSVINVFANPVIYLPGDSVICYGETAILDAGAGFKTYAWNTGDTHQQITVNAIGLYAITVTDENGCSGADTTVIKKIADPPSDFLNPNFTKCSYDTALLQSNQAYLQYLWSTGATGSFIKVINNGTYWLQVTDSNACTGKEYTTVTEKECASAIYFPTAFTPNGDRLNDVFKPKLFGKITSFKLIIYNRFGQIIFSTNDAYKGWDGTINGQPQSTANFVWKCSYQLQGEQPVITKGIFTLLR